MVCDPPLNSLRATRDTLSPVVSSTESSLMIRSPPIPKGRFPFTPMHRLEFYRSAAWQHEFGGAGGQSLADQSMWQQREKCVHRQGKAFRPRHSARPSSCGQAAISPSRQIFRRNTKRFQWEVFFAKVAGKLDNFYATYYYLSFLLRAESLTNELCMAGCRVSVAIRTRVELFVSEQSAAARGGGRYCLVE